MIRTPDRQRAVELIDEARAGGARLRPACELLGITSRTYQRWTGAEAIRSDGRPTAERPRPAHALSPAERHAVLEVCCPCGNVIRVECRWEVPATVGQPVSPGPADPPQPNKEATQ